MADNETMRKHLLELFEFNRWANGRILDTFLPLDGIDEPLRLFSHLINSQNKWMNRIEGRRPDSELSWQTPGYFVSDIRSAWEQSAGMWITFLQSHADVDREIRFQATDGGKFRATISSIALQLNFHSIHHRAQIMAWLRSRGVAPPQSDYILLKRRPDAP